MFAISLYPHTKIYGKVFVLQKWYPTLCIILQLLFKHYVIDIFPSYFTLTYIFFFHKVRHKVKKQKYH